MFNKFGKNFVLFEYDFWEWLCYILGINPRSYI